MREEERTIVELPGARGPISEQNRAAIRLIKSWLREDTDVEVDTWERLKAELDRDRLSHRKLFP